MILTILLGLPLANFEDSRSSQKIVLFAFFIAASNNNVSACCLTILTPVAFLLAPLKRYAPNMLGVIKIGLKAALK